MQEPGPEGECPSRATGELNPKMVTDDALTDAQERHPHWGIWISSAGRYWASRQGNIRLSESVHSGWAMTVDADSLPELETRLKEQEEYDQPLLSLGHFEGSEEILRKEGRRDDR
jgi:hypothetical protein